MPGSYFFLTFWLSLPVVSASINELLRPNEPRAVGNVISTAGKGMGSPVSAMNVRTTDTASSVHSSNITAPNAGDRLLI